MKKYTKNIKTLGDIYDYIEQIILKSKRINQEQKSEAIEKLNLWKQPRDGETSVEKINEGVSVYEKRRVFRDIQDYVRVNRIKIFDFISYETLSEEFIYWMCYWLDLQGVFNHNPCSFDFLKNNVERFNESLERFNESLYVSNTNSFRRGINKLYQVIFEKNKYTLKQLETLIKKYKTEEEVLYYLAINQKLNASFILAHSKILPSRGIVLNNNIEFKDQSKVEKDLYEWIFEEGENKILMFKM